VCLCVGQDFSDELDRALDVEGVAFLLLFHHDGGAHHLSSGHDE
jgi:hypothetical protein